MTTDLVRVRRALISVSDKTDLIPFARGLRDLGVAIVSTGGTARALAEAEIETIPVERLTGFPEMMDGRVKTLHPLVHGGLLARRDVAEHVAAMERHGIEAIDLVCINLYPFEQTIAREGTTPEEAIEKIDIGGPAMIRSAAKNHDFVAVVTAPGQYDRVIAQLKAQEGATTRAFRRDLAAAAFSRTAAYDTAIAAWMAARREEAFPALLRLTYAHSRDLRYGENPHQRAALYVNPASGEPSIVTAEVLRGKPLSYNNINDAAAALRCVQDLADLRPDHAAAVIVKHATPCGLAIAGDPAEAFAGAHAGDPVAAYGGILALSRRVDTATAERIGALGSFLEVVVAPGWDEAAVERLAARWPNARLLSVAGLAHTGHRKIDYRSIPGGLLAQERDMRIAEPDRWTIAVGPEPDAALRDDAVLAWVAAKHLASNAIAIAAGGRLIGAGSGQVDRVGACRIAVEKARSVLAEGAPAVAASDAFFPFDDGPRVLLDAGVRCLVHPGGSKRDEETFALCRERGAACLVTGVRHFRH